MKPGDLVRYASRVVLVIDISENWIQGLELGETEVGKYKKSVLRLLSPENNQAFPTSSNCFRSA